MPSDSVKDLGPRFFAEQDRLRAGDRYLARRRRQGHRAARGVRSGGHDAAARGIGRGWKAYVM